MKHRDIATVLEAQYKTDVMYCKGGFLLRGKPAISMAKARQITGIAGKKRNPRMHYMPGGDYATIVMLNQQRKGV